MLVVSWCVILTLLPCTAWAFPVTVDPEADSNYEMGCVLDRIIIEVVPPSAQSVIYEYTCKQGVNELKCVKESVYFEGKSVGSQRTFLVLKDTDQRCDVVRQPPPGIYFPYGGLKP